MVNGQTKFKLIWTRRLILTFFFLLFAVSALQNVDVVVPAAVRRGDNAKLYCLYDLEGDSLYAVKWYKGRREFYRYTPKENPAMKTFSNNGITVLVSNTGRSKKIASGNEVFFYYFLIWFFFFCLFNRWRVKLRLKIDDFRWSKHICSSSTTLYRLVHRPINWMFVNN